jgi:5-formyltetrahydrofolate cyclo-ligase
MEHGGLLIKKSMNTRKAAEKKILRIQVKEMRMKAARQGAAASCAMRDHFLSNVTLPDQAIIAFYLPQTDEIDPLPLIKFIYEHGHVLCLPAVEEKGRPLVFRAYRFGDPFKIGSLGLAEPQSAAPIVKPDVLIVPVVAFDRQGNRLGQGGGYYDMTIAKLRASGPVMAIGVGFAIQEVPSLPVEAHDMRLDAIVTDREFFLTKEPLGKVLK